jgi:hypothetical protein
VSVNRSCCSHRRCVCCNIAPHPHPQSSDMLAAAGRPSRQLDWQGEGDEEGRGLRTADRETRQCSQTASVLHSYAGLLLQVPLPVFFVPCPLLVPVPVCRRCPFPFPSAAALLCSAQLSSVQFTAQSVLAPLALLRTAVQCIHSPSSIHTFASAATSVPLLPPFLHSTAAAVVPSA